MTNKKQHWASHRVKGAYYYRDTPAFRELRDIFIKGTPYKLTLMRDPNNRYDSNAIKVLAHDGKTLIGYVPRESNQQLGMLMDSFGAQVEAVLTKDSNFMAHLLYMDIFLVDVKPVVSNTEDSKYMEDDYVPIPKSIIKPIIKPTPKMSDFI